jgi:hypothetical protein
MTIFFFSICVRILTISIVDFEKGCSNPSFPAVRAGGLPWVGHHLDRSINVACHYFCVITLYCVWHLMVLLLLLQRSKFDISIDDFDKAAGNPSIPVSNGPVHPTSASLYSGGSLAFTFPLLQSNRSGHLTAESVVPCSQSEDSTLSFSEQNVDGKRVRVQPPSLKAASRERPVLRRTSA